MTTPTHPGTALITGASSGIGEVYADRLARRGYDLVLIARNEARLAALAARLSAATGRSVEWLAADLGVAADVEKVEARLRSDASVTLLVNNAGLLASGPLATSSPADLEAMLAVNVVAPSRLASAAAAAFAARGQGTIINLGSAMAFIDTPTTAAYGASKAFILNFTLSLDLELRTQGVRVQAVLPGYTRTPMIGAGAGLPDEVVMEVDDLVDAALAGLDAGEVVTIPSLSDTAAYENWAEARKALQPQLSLRRPAARYGIKLAEPA